MDAKYLARHVFVLQRVKDGNPCRCHPHLTQKTNAEEIGKGDILLVPACCGSLCKYMMVASGRASVFILRATTRKVMKKISGYAPAWDHAVGIICVHEAGGEVTDWEGSSIDFAADQISRRTVFPSGGFLVTNLILHNEILGLISSNKPIL